MQHTERASTPPSSLLDAVLMLEDGTFFYGKGIGQSGMAAGELCFNTAMSGYQEVLTDPSYAGQIVTFTFPHIGNVGTNFEDIESTHPMVRGLVVREMLPQPSSHRSQSHLGAWLEQHKITGISGVDTRKLTNHLRSKGAKNAIIHYGRSINDLDVSELRRQAKGLPSLSGMELARDAGAAEPYEWTETVWSQASGYGTQANPTYHVVAIDYGAKLNMLRHVAERGCRVTVVPADYPAAKILALKPDGILLTNGPGDPAATVKYAGPIIRALLEAGLPIFGICLGHQLLCLSLGARTPKMHQGHRGANHPIKNVETGHVEITSQNHGFVVSPGSLPENVLMTHFSLFDQTLAGIRMRDRPVFSVQYHPEASPGPHDSLYLFDRFVDNVRQAKAA
jgi:carbamoyl-phosphate synthase small subunit